MSILSWSRERLRARLALFVTVVGLVMGVHAIAPGHARALLIDCTADPTNTQCGGSGPSGGGTDGTTDPGGTTNPDGTTNPGGTTNQDGTTNPDGTTDPGGTTNPDGTTNPTDPGGTTNPDGTTNPTDPGGTTDPNGFVISCEGASICTVTDQDGNPVTIDDNGNLVPLGDPKYDRDLTPPALAPQSPNTKDVPPGLPVFFPGSMPTPVYEPYKQNPCGPYLQRIDDVYNQADKGQIDQEAAQAQVKALGELYQQCTTGRVIARVDPSRGHGLTGPAAAVAARQATQARVQLRAANVAARAATQAAMRAAAASAQAQGASPKASRKRHAKRHRG